MWGIDALAKLVEKKVEDIGRETIMGLLAETPIGFGLEVASRFSEFLETGGKSELERFVELPKPDLSGGEYFRKLADLVEKAKSSKDRRAKWMHSSWAQSRQQWLEEGWRHNWRSQPRNSFGRWIPGRLPYPEYYGKAHTSRRRRRFLRARRVSRRAGRQAVRDLHPWSRDGK